MKELFKTAFSKVSECPKCGAPLKVTNTPTLVAMSCSEDELHYITQKLRASSPTETSRGEQSLGLMSGHDPLPSLFDFLKELKVKRPAVNADTPCSKQSIVDRLKQMEREIGEAGGTKFYF